MNPYDVLDGAVQMFHHPGARYVAQIVLNGAIAYANSRSEPRNRNFIFAAVIPVATICLAEVPFTTHHDAGKIFDNQFADIAVVEATAYTLQFGALIAKQRSLLRKARGGVSAATLDSALDPRFGEKPADQ